VEKKRVKRSHEKKITVGSPEWEERRRNGVSNAIHLSVMSSRARAAVVKGMIMTQKGTC